MLLRALAALFLLQALTAVPSAARPRGADDRPNVIVLLADDLGYGDLGLHGNPDVDTPRLDRLAKESVRFRRFYVSPHCAATRASLLTGRWALRTGTRGVNRRRETLRGDEVTLAEALRAAGYATAVIGKWHNGSHGASHPNGQGFDEFFGFSAGHWNDYFDTFLERNGVREETTGYITEVFTREAVRFIEDHRRRPFFLYLPFNTPHGPLQAPPRLEAKYLERGLDRKTARVYGMVEEIDTQVGRLLDRLDRLRLRRRTVVVFLSDNGPNTDRFTAGLRGYKGGVHEGSVRVPFFLRWTGRLDPQDIDTVAAHVDLVPTLLDLVGASELAEDSRLRWAGPLDGRSLVPLMRGKTRGDWPERYLFHHQSARAGLKPWPGSVRDQRWLATRRDPEAGWKLWDVDADPGQRNNLAKDRPGVLTRLSAAYDAWFADVSVDVRDAPPVAVGPFEGAGRPPATVLAADEAELDSVLPRGLRFSDGKGRHHAWIDRWRDPGGRVSWPLDVATPGRYGITVEAACRARPRGIPLHVEVAGQGRYGFVPVVRGRRWRAVPFGEVELPAGETILELQSPGLGLPDCLEIRGARLQWRGPLGPTPAR